MMETHEQARKATLFALSFLLICTVNLAFGAELSKEKRAYLREKGEVVFVSQTTYPPFEFVDERGGRQGMCIELARWMATELGFKARFIDMTFKEAQEAILSGKADVLTSFFYSEKRDEIFDFTQTMYNVPALIFVRAERPDIISLEDLEGKRIAMQRGDYAREFLESKGISFKMIPTASFAEATDRVITYDADAVVGDEQIVLYHLFSNNLTDQVKSVGEPLYVGKNCMGVKEGSRTLTEILNQGLDLARERGVFESINRKWVGVQYAPPGSFMSRYFPQVITVGLALLGGVLLIVFWNFSLRRLVEERTKELQEEISVRVLAEDALRESEERFRNLTENIPGVSIQGYGIDGTVFYWNKASEEVYGYTAQEAIGKNLADLIIPPDLLAHFKQNLNMGANITESGEFMPSGELILLRKDGSPAPVYSIHTAVCLEGREPMLFCIDVDLSERKRAEEEKERLEEQLHHALKMEAVGTLAGGIAHEFNNLLQGVQGYAELLLSGKNRGDPEYNDLNEIIQAAKKGGELTKQLLAFSRRADSELRPTDLNNIVLKTGDILKHTIPRMIDIDLFLADDLDTINADSGQIEQVLMNLAVNAKDAMPDGGKLTITTQNFRPNDEFSSTHPDMQPGDYVLLTVSDTGHGMDERTLEKIFDPFYTTKKIGEGTGLGLSMVYGVVDSHKGTILYESEVGRGTTFKIYLPAIEHAPKPSDKEIIDVGPGGIETLLLIDDEDFIRRLGEQTLSKFGYTVLTADDGEKGLDIYREKQDEIDLVILDLIMPGMGGKRCLEGLLKIDPHIKIVVASGYSAGGPIRECIDRGAKGFVGKPYDIKHMLMLIRDVLDENLDM